MAAANNQQNRHHDNKFICKKFYEKKCQLSIYPDNRGLNQVQPQSKNQDKPIPSKPPTPSISSPQREEKQPTSMNTVIVFDFEDILFPSSQFRGIYAGSNWNQWWQLTQLSHYTYDMLLAYIEQYSKRNICIVTSEGPEWMKFVLSQVDGIGFYAQIYDLIFDPQQKDPNKISIYYQPTRKASTLSMLKKEDIEPNDIWTPPGYETLSRIFRQKTMDLMDYSTINTFVIIGESLNQYVAAGLLREEFGAENVFINRIKLEHRPCIRSLLQTHNALQELCGSKYYTAHSSLKQWFDFELLD